MPINTFNESALHRSLKTFYSVREKGETEVQVEKWICDIVTQKGCIIEIQNLNIGALKEKISGLLALKKKVTVVHPVVKIKIIETYGSDKTIISRRKSPKKGDIYSVLKELTGITPFLLDKNFTLLCPEISIVEKRLSSREPVQSKNRRRRFRKNWNKSDKELLTIGEEHRFHGKKSYISLLPEGLPPEFSSVEVREFFKAKNETNAARESGLLLWLLHKTGLTERVPHKGRAYYYRLTENVGN